MHVNQVAVARGPNWITSGWELFRENAGLWIAMAAIYMVCALLLQRIPYLGYPILVLITPLIAASAVAFAEQREPSVAQIGDLPITIRAKALLQQGGSRLIEPLRDPERILPVMVIATLTLGAMVVVQILAQILKVGGAAVPAMLSGSVGPSIWIPALVSLVLVWALKLGLIMISFFAVCLIMLRRETPLTAMESGIRGAASNIGPLSVIAGAFLVPLGLGAYLPPPLGYLVLLVIGLVTLPLFIASSYAAFKELFAAS